MARERTASPTHPREGLSRQELAELVNTWVWDHYNKEVLATANYVGKLETGLIRWPNEFRREALRAILGAPTDDALGFVNARSRHAAVKLGNVDRQNLIRGGAALSVSTLVQGPVAALLEGLERSKPTPRPKRVGATDIKQIRNAARVFESWDCTYGGESVRDAVIGKLRWSAGLLDAICPDELSPELHSALGDLAAVAGYIAEGAGAPEQAGQVYSFALARAEEAKDWPLRAEVLSSMAKKAIRAGQPDNGLTLAELALVRADRLTVAGRSMLHSDRGRALARMHRVQETLTAIGTADDHFAHFTPNNEPPWMANYNSARHAQLTGQPLFYLAVLGCDPGEATDRLAAAAAGQPDDALCQTICQAKLASLTMVTGDPLQGATIGHAAVDAAGTLRSQIAAEELRELSHHAATHQKLDEVAHLRHRIATLLVRTDSPQGEGESFPP